MADSPNYVPVIIIGAGRSGTKILRDVLARLPGAGTWPCDEINYIWRHGNAAHPDDELDPTMARPSVRRFIRRAFDRLARRRGLTHVIEKTCANSLRVGFVHRIFPGARFVFIVRDGRDVTASALERWRAPLDLAYLARKARFVPWRDLPYYAVRYLGNRLHRWVSDERRVSWWGPRFKGWDEASRREGLVSLCARQWVRCVEKAEADVAALPPVQVLRLRYEDLVARPDDVLREILEFLGIDIDEEQVGRYVGAVESSSVGRWRTRLTDAQIEEIQTILAPTLARYGYGGQP